MKNQFFCTMDYFSAKSHYKFLKSLQKRSNEIFQQWQSQENVGSPPAGGSITAGEEHEGLIPRMEILSVTTGERIDGAD